VRSEIRQWLLGRAGGLKLVVVTVSLVAALVAGSAASAAPKRFDMGVYDPTANQIGGGAAYSTLGAGLAMSKTKATRSRFVRIPVNWDRIACSSRSEPCQQIDRPVRPRNPSSLDRRGQRAYAWARPGWYDYDEEIQAALARGLEPVLSVFGIPAYAECNGHGKRFRAKPGKAAGRLSCTGRKDEANYKPDVSDYADFMIAVSRRYPRVHYFQVLNEPNYSFFLKPALKDSTIARYRNLVNATYRALHLPMLGGARRGDYVVAGGTSPNPRPTGSIRAFSPKEFLRKLVARRVRFDIYDTHPYTQGGPRTSAPRGYGAIWMGDLWRVNRILRRAKAQGKIRGRPLRFWAAEFGWDSAPPDCRRLHYNSRWGYHRAVRGGLLTRWVSESAYRMWRQGVSAMIWGQLKDFPISQNAHQGGLYFWGGNHAVGRRKQSLRAFQFPFVAFKRERGAYVWGRLPNSKPGKVNIQRRVGGKWRHVKQLTAKRGRNGLFSARLYFSRWKVTALRARVPRRNGMGSAAFALKVPRTPRGILPFGCDSSSRPA
jgi:hypothetical protein